MDARMEAQGLKFEELRLKQEEELAAIKKYQEDKTAKQEKRPKEMEAMLNFLLRTSQQSSQGN
jgi:ribosome-binding protein aMBF1 (putative translation factor)